MHNIACIEPFMTYEGDEIAPETKKGSSNNWKMNTIECMMACQFNSRYARGHTYMSYITSVLFELLTHLIADVIFGSSCPLPSVANCLARMETPKGLKSIMHDLDHIWCTTISNYRWLSTKIRIAGPKYCKDTTYVGEIRIMILSCQLCWVMSFAGCLFHGRRFLSQDEIETKEAIPTWQVSEVCMSHVISIRLLR